VLYKIKKRNGLDLKGVIMKKFSFPVVLLALYIVWFVILGINPYSRSVWCTENAPIVLIVLCLVFTYRRFRFSNTSYFLMAILVFMHTFGGHYTFERVPFDFISNLFGFSRNHYDRIAHFSVGFYAFPLAELLDKKKMTTSVFVLLFFPICFIFSVASIYEIFEWIYAVSADPSAGLAVLGSQGDLWDAQKDMLADGLGSVTAIIFYFAQRKRN
jgi:putative membrane protein